MEYMKAFAIKFAIVSVVIYSIFGVFLNASMGNLFWLSLLITGALFVISDLLLLPRIGTVWTTILDFGFIYLLYFSGCGRVSCFFFVLSCFFIRHCIPDLQFIVTVSYDYFCHWFFLYLRM